MRLALRNLFHETFRLALSVIGVALAIMLVLLLTGFQRGMNQQVTAYLTRSPGALVVAQEGVSNLLGATSLLPQGSLEAVRGVEGVEAALPILSQFIILDLHGKKQPVYLIGYDPALGGGPWRLAEGREPAAVDEVVFDRVLAERHNLALEGSFALMDRTVRIVGLSDETTSWMTSFLFVDKGLIEQLLRAPGATSYVLVTPTPSVAASALRERLGELPGVDVVTKEEMKANDLKIFVRVFSAPLTLMVAIAFLVGTLIVGLIIYTATVERQREYGVLKAVGSRNGLLYRVVLIQALVAAGAGALLGVGLSLGAARLIMALRPQFLIALEQAMILRALVAGLGMAVLAAIVPARTVARLAPAEIFRR